MTDLALAFGQRGLSGLRIVFASFAAQWFFLVVPVCYFISNFLVFARMPHQGIVMMLTVTLGVLIFALPIGLVSILLVRLFGYLVAGQSSFVELRREINDFAQSPARLVNGLPILVAVIFLNKALLELKTSIPTIHPFDWDETFARLDRTLHFGIDPWVLLQTVMGHAGITFVGNLFYSLWFFVMFGALLWFGFQKQASELRSRFFLSYMLLWWIGGGLLSVCFASAGPAFYGALGLPNDPYVGLMSYLHDADSRMPVFSLAVQQHLWEGYQGKKIAVGISAFPSMHNGSAFLVALAFRPISRVLSNIFFGFTAIIFITSIHLGWHYAVDGYAAFALAGLFWWMTGPIVSYLHRQQSMKQFNDQLAVFSTG